MKVTIETGVAPYSDAWAGFRGEEWKNAVNVRDFIQHNYTPYEGDEAFLAQATPATTALWQKVMVGIRQENATHAPVDFDTNIATTITAHGPGYIDQIWRRSSACKPTSRSSAPCIRTAGST